MREMADGDDLLMSSTEDKPALISEFSLRASHLYSALHSEKANVDLLHGSRSQNSTAPLPAALLLRGCSTMGN